MPFDDLLVRNEVQRMGVNASIDWIRQCIAHAQSQGTPDSKLASFILDMYLLADLRTLDPKSLIPSSIQTPHKQTLFGDNSAGGAGGGSGGGSRDPLGREKGGGVILQIIEIQDIGISSLKILEACDAVGTAGDEPGGLQVGKSFPQASISLDLTDGIRMIQAFLLEPIFGIAVEMLLGAKIRVRNADVRHGMLMLSPKNTFLLGGEVASMNEYPRRLVIMNQMKKRLGLPMDVIQGLNQNGANATSATPATPATPAAGRQSNNTAPTVNNNVSAAKTNTTINTGWKNPQSAVSAQDAVPSRTPSTMPAQQPSSSATISNSNNKDVSYNPWISFQRNHTSPSPPPPPRSAAADDDYLRMQREQEPVWDDHPDMELDNLDIPEDDGEWEVMSQLSMGGGQNKSGISKSRDSSPPLIATSSPSRRSSSIRKNISLRAPHSQDKEKVRAEWEVDRLPKRSNSRGGNNGSDGRRPASASPSPKADEDFMAEYRRKLEDQTASLDEMTRQEPDYGDYYDQDLGALEYPDPFQDDVPLEDEPLDRKKRRTSPDSKSSPDRDHYPSRRRSQSFSTPQWNEETKVDIKLEPGSLDIPNKETFEPAVFSKKDSSKLDLVENKDRPEIEDSRASPPVIKVKVEAAEPTRVNGASYHAVIDLSSDDDDDTDAASSNVCGGERVSGSQAVRIKQEPDDITSSQTGRKRETDHWVPVKQEETLLEFEMDDEDDFGGLAEVIPIIPLVELTRVEQDVRSGQEVKAKARVHKLGKFSLTTQSASIPITLLPVDPVPTDSASSDGDVFKLESVLEQHVVESLLQYSITEFRSLVRVNEPEAKRAVTNLRATLLEVELVECQFKGLRTGVPVIRELMVLSKKRK
ncbi:hypothetical protein BGX29_000737 [Mortierella sp. GBA35]|nr:hypothetical protein BGX29_000737 [Mortierella sp. GBA35]